MNQRICITCPLSMLQDYREIAAMMNCSVSHAILRRLEVRGTIVAVPASIGEELQSLHVLLDKAIQCGGLDSETVEAWNKRLAMYDRLLDYDGMATFWHGRKERRTINTKGKEAVGC